MIEIFQNLYIGDALDYESSVKHQKGWWIIHACKEPYHRNLLGYKGRGAPKDHPEYLYAVRENRLILNLVDADDPNYIPKPIIDRSLKFIEKGLQTGNKVLVHCNKGESRSPGIGMLYLIANTNVLPKNSFEQAELEFKNIYPSYNPKKGIRGFLLRNWKIYLSEYYKNNK
jgi:hypothetical protein